MAALCFLYCVASFARAEAAGLVDQTPAPAGVVDVASCQVFLASLGSDDSYAQTGCQAMQTLAQTVNQPFSTVFGCAWTQATNVDSGAQVDTATLMTCLGAGP